MISVLWPICVFQKLQNKDIDQHIFCLLWKQMYFKDEQTVLQVYLYSLLKAVLRLLISSFGKASAFKLLQPKKSSVRKKSDK